MVGAGKRPYRLGLDVGSNSLGWFMVWLDEQGRPKELGPGGVRIYPDGRDPQSKTSNAVDRRMARGARRRRDRYLRRRASLMSLLVAHGLMPRETGDQKALEGLDPYELRAGALDETLPAHHIGRALFHLNQRRGFLSNRKTEKKDNEAGAIKQAAGSRLGLRAIKAILPHMEGGMNYPDAAKAAGYDHALLPTGELSPNGRLPYYGEWLQDDVLGSGDPRHSL